jgi:hypothetical protein
VKAKEVKQAAANVAKKTSRAMQPVIKKLKRAAEDAGDELKKQGRIVAKKALLASSKKLKKAAKAI